MDEALGQVLAAERLTALLKQSGSDESDRISAMATQLNNRFQDVARFGLQTAHSAAELQAVLVDLGAYERRSFLLGRAGSSDSASRDASLFTRQAAMLQGELTRQFQATGLSLKDSYAAVRGRLAAATRIEDADAAVALYAILSLPALPPGYTEAERSEQFAALQTLLRDQAPVLLTDTVSRMRMEAPAALVPLAARYFTLIPYSSDSGNVIDRLFNDWATQAEVFPCAGSDLLVARVLSPASRFLSLSGDNAHDHLVSLFTRCQMEAGTGAAAQNVAYYDTLRTEQFRALGSFLDDLEKRVRNGEPEAILKEELAWKLGEQVQGLTAAFAMPSADTQRTLWRVHEQTAYVLRYRRATLNQRVEAGIRLISEPILAQEGIPANVRDEIRRVSDGLILFAQQGGAVKTGTDLALDLAYGLAATHLDGYGTYVAITYAGLMEARRNARNPEPGQSTQSGWNRAVSGVGWGINFAGMVFKLTGQLDALHASTRTATTTTTAAPAVASPSVPTLWDLVGLIGSLSNGLSAKDSTPFGRMDALLSFVDNAEDPGGAGLCAAAHSPRSDSCCPGPGST